MTALDRQEQEIVLNLSMATKPSVELQDPSTMRVVENLHWRGAGEIEKVAANDVDHAVAAPPGSVYPRGNACGLVLRENDPVMVTGSHGVMTHEPRVAEGAQWARRESIYEFSPRTDGGLKYAPASYNVSRRFVERTQNRKFEIGISQVASAQHRGVHVVAWIVQGVSTGIGVLLRLKAIEADTGKVVATLEHADLAAGFITRVSACEYTEAGKEGVLIAYANGDTFPYTIKCLRYSYALQEFVADSALTTNATRAGGTVAFTVRKNGARFYLAFVDHTTGNLTVQDRTVATITATHAGTHSAVRGVDVLPGPTRTLIVSADLTTFYAEVFGAPASAITLATAVDEGFQGCTAALETRSVTTHDAVAWVNCMTAVPGEPGATRVIAREVNFSATTPTAGYQTSVPHAWCASAGFTLQGRAHVAMALGFYPLLATQTARTPITCVVARYAGHPVANMARHDPVAKLCHGRFYLRANAQNADVFSSTYTDQNDNAWLALPADPAAAPSDTGIAAVYPQTIFLARIDAKRPMPMPYAAPEPGVVVVAGGAPWQFDGDTPAELAPLMRPMVYLDVSAGTGVTGSYGVVAMWKWVDAAGRLHRIASLPVLTTIANKQIDLYVSQCPLAAYDNRTAPSMDVEVYITGDTASGGSPTYQLVMTINGSKHTYASITPNGLWWKFTIMNPAYATGVTDAIFTTEIAPEPVPAFFHIAKVVDRMVAIDAEDRGRIWFSKPLVAGFGVEWATSCTLTIGDECTAVVDAQGGIVVLARGGTYLVSGAGPDGTVASLATSPFSPAVKLSNEVDCIDPVSVCRTPVGALFRGRRGFYVLSGTQAQPFGVPIDPEVLTDPALDPSSLAMVRMRAVWQEQTSEIHLVAPGARYIFSLAEQKWSRRVVRDTAGFEAPTVDVVVARGKLWRHDRNGGLDFMVSERLYSEVGEDYNTGDQTEWAIETPWIKPDDVGGQCRVWRVWWSLAVPALTPSELGDFIRLTYYRDYSTSGTQQVAWTYDEVVALRNAGERVVELPFCPAVQMCKAFKFRLETVSTGASAIKPLSLRLRLGVRPSKSKRLRSEAKG